MKLNENEAHQNELQTYLTITVTARVVHPVDGYYVEVTTQIGESWPNRVRYGPVPVKALVEVQSRLLHEEADRAKRAMLYGLASLRAHLEAFHLPDDIRLEGDGPHGAA